MNSENLIYIINNIKSKTKSIKLDYNNEIFKSNL